MIRINLLAVERDRARTRARFQFAQKLTVACSLILVATGLLIGWWYWTLRENAVEQEQQIASAQNETARLRVLIRQVLEFEKRRADLQQRVTLIEQLRKDQNAPVHLLDEVSHCLPDGLWLTAMRRKGSEITIEGKCLNLTAVSEFVANLQASRYFKRPVDPVSTGTDRNDRAGIDLVTFSLKAQFAMPDDEGSR
jgi:type IV pilus assembly protein PilN